MTCRRSLQPFLLAVALAAAFAWPALVSAAGPGEATDLVEPTRSDRVARKIPGYAPIVDETGLVDAGSLDAVRRISDATALETGARLAVLVVATLEGEDPERLSRDVYRAWRLGRASQDDGALLVYSTGERWLQLEVGAALRERLARSGGGAALGPAIEEVGDGAPGPVLVEAVTALARAAGASQEAVADPYQRRFDWSRVWYVGLLALGFVVYVAGTTALKTWGERRRQREAAVALASGRPVQVLRLEFEPDRVTVKSGPPVLLTLAATLFLPALGVFLVAHGWSRGVETLWCSHQDRACTVILDGNETFRLPLQVIQRVEVFQGGSKAPAELRAVTAHGNELLLSRWPPSRLEAHAATLEAFRLDPEAPPVAFSEDFRRPSADQAAVLAFLAAIGLLLWSLLGTRVLVLDRAANQVTFGRPLWRRRRALSDLVGLRLWSKTQAKIERVRRERLVMPYVLEVERGRNLALVFSDGTTWTGTRIFLSDVELLDAANAEVAAAAERISTFIGVPVLPPYEVPPGGAVPPPIG